MLGERFNLLLKTNSTCLSGLKALESGFYEVFSPGKRKWPLRNECKNVLKLLLNKQHKLTAMDTNLCTRLVSDRRAVCDNGRNIIKLRVSATPLF